MSSARGRSNCSSSLRFCECDGALDCVEDWNQRFFSAFVELRGRGFCQGCDFALVIMLNGGGIGFVEVSDDDDGDFQPLPLRISQVSVGTQCKSCAQILYC